MTSYSPRILRVRYRSQANGRVGEAYVKAPYGAIYALDDTLTRAIATEAIMWFRVDVVPAKLITPELRARLQRWPEALRSTTPITKVEWSA